MALEYAHGAIQWLAADGASTTYTVSGLSFQPQALRFTWCGLQSATDAASGAVNEQRGVGFAVGTSARRCVGSFSQDTAATSNCGSGSGADGACAASQGDEMAIAPATIPAGRSDLLMRTSIDERGYERNGRRFTVPGLPH